MGGEKEGRREGEKEWGRKMEEMRKEEGRGRERERNRFRLNKEASVTIILMELQGAYWCPLKIDKIFIIIAPRIFLPFLLIFILPSNTCIVKFLSLACVMYFDYVLGLFLIRPLASLPTLHSASPSVPGLGYLSGWISALFVSVRLIECN